jgi:hypothetical protein
VALIWLNTKAIGKRYLYEDLRIHISSQPRLSDKFEIEYVLVSHY